MLSVVTVFLEVFPAETSYQNPAFATVWKVKFNKDFLFFFSFLLSQFMKHSLRDKMVKILDPFPERKQVFTQKELQLNEHRISTYIKSNKS